MSKATVPASVSTLLNLAQACALPKADAIAYLEARCAKGFANEAKKANWTTALASLRAGKTPDTKPQIGKIIEAAKAAPAPVKAPKVAKTEVAFSRATEVLPALAKAPKTIKATNERIDRIEIVLMAMARKMGVIAE